MKIIENVLKEYAKSKLNSLDDYTKRLITAATYDLYFGPIGEYPDDSPDEEGNYPEGVFRFPGFESACKKISEGVDAIVDSAIWININFEDWTTEEPRFDDSDETSPIPEDFYKVDRSELIKAIVGKELVQYI